MTIREAKSEDIPSIVLLGKDLLGIHIGFDNNYYELEDNFEEQFAGWVKSQLNSPLQFLITAEENGEIVGLVSGFIKGLYPWFKLKSVGHIGYLIVKKEYRQKGTGKRLEEAAVNWFRSHNLKFIEAYVDEKNSLGQIAWNKYGYIPFKKFIRKKI